MTRLVVFCAMLATGLSFPMSAISQSAADAWLKAAGPVPALQIPPSLDEWRPKRAEIRKTLLRLLGDMPPRPLPSEVKSEPYRQEEGYRVEKLSFDNGAGEHVTGYCFVPDGATAEQKAPAILYCHWHGGQYEIGKEELFGTNATPVTPGPALAKLGYVVVGIDAPCFGERNGKGPDGPKQTGSAGEMSASKFHLWQGRTLWGMMLRDDLTALDYLAARPEVDASKIGVTGISMGSTRAWWIMSLDDRPKAASCVACMTRYQDLIQEGMLKAHGIYYYVPGMLRHFDTEAVIALAAPRAMLFQTGDQDGGSPATGVKTLGEIVEKVYALHGKQTDFENILYPGVAHVYLPQMWERTVAWFGQHLR
ncbi:MAG: dienelactone hydrolase family protein [Verrucomicrobiaceae bacterium]|nr:dienelactone hydrolase family protein [Verrucomicrobiaceae bacterium]